MKRRRYLGLLGAGVVGTSGCLDTPAETDSAATGTTTARQSETASTTESPTASNTPGPSTAPVSGPDVTTPVPGECEAEPVPQPSTEPGLPDPREYPETPREFDEPTVRAFLETYEATYRYNRRLAEIAADGNCLSHLEMYTTDSQVTTVEGGLIGEVTTRGSFTGATCPGTTGTDTPTPLPHADLAHETARYYVTERFLVRDREIVACWK